MEKKNDDDEDDGDILTLARGHKFTGEGITWHGSRVNMYK